MRKKMNISLAELIALDAVLDTMVFGRPLGLFGENLNVKEETAEPEENKVSVIGKKMRVLDNSYAKCLETGNDARLCGTDVVLTSEPYSKQVHEDWAVEEFGELNVDMVKSVSPYDGRHYETMFSVEGMALAEQDNK